MGFFFCLLLEAFLALFLNISGFIVHSTIFECLNLSRTLKHVDGDRNLERKVPDIAKSGFTSAWLPPATHSFSSEGWRH